jgi:hypothetical protein
MNTDEERERKQRILFFLCVWINLDYIVPRVQTFANRDHPPAQANYLHVDSDDSVNIDREVPRTDRQFI